MKHSLIFSFDNQNNIIGYIEYIDSNDKVIEKINLTVKDFEIYKDENYIYFTQNSFLIKVFDINNKSFIKDKLTMYYQFNNYLNRIKPKKNKTYSYILN